MGRYSEGWRVSWFLLGVITLVIAVAALVILRNGPGFSGNQDSPANSKQNQKVHFVRSRSFWVLASIYLLFGFSYIIFATFFGRFLTGEALIGERTAGSLWSTIGAVSIISGFVWGAASDRFGRRNVLAAICAIQATAYLIFSLSNSLSGYTVASVLFAITAWSIPAVMGAAIGDIFGPKAAPALFGFVTLIFGIGQALGPSVAGTVAQISGSYAPAYQIAAAAAAIGALTSFLLPSHVRRSQN